MVAYHALQFHFLILFVYYNVDAVYFPARYELLLANTFSLSFYWLLPAKHADVATPCASLVLVLAHFAMTCALLWGLNEQ